MFFIGFLILLQLLLILRLYLHHHCCCIMGDFCIITVSCLLQNRNIFIRILVKDVQHQRMTYFGIIHQQCFLQWNHLLLFILLNLDSLISALHNILGLHVRIASTQPVSAVFIQTYSIAYSSKERHCINKRHHIFPSD